MGEVTRETSEGGKFRLGRDALVLEIVRFRSEESEGLTDAVFSHELRLTRQILSDVAPTVIIAIGSDVVWQLRKTYSELLDAVPETIGSKISKEPPFWCMMRRGGP